MNQVTIWLVVFMTTAQAQGPGVAQRRKDGELLTIRGKLEVYRVELEDGKELYQLTLDGKVIDTESEYHVVSISNSYPEKGPAHLVLLQLTTGGSGCPMFYRVLEFKEDGSTIRSKEFGNCLMVQRSSFTNGVLRMTLPKPRGSSTESWSYQNGKISKAASTSHK